MSTAGEISGVGYERDPLDWYVEPRWTVDILLDAEAFTGRVWDPACGSGTIPKACRSRGLESIGTDIADRPFGDRHDFFDPVPADIGAVANIVCNPPYAAAEAFVRRALGIASDRVVMLLQGKFLYSQRRYPLFAEHPPSSIYFLSTRPSMPPGDLLLSGEIRAAGGKLDFIWIVWTRDHPGPTVCRWLLRR